MTASFIMRDKLRNTTLARIEGKQMQGLAFTSRAGPLLQNVIQVESIENLVQFLLMLDKLWSSLCPARPPLPDSVVQMHKDYHPAIKHARQVCLRKSRPMNDFFHLTEKHKTMEAKLHHTVMDGGVLKKRDFGWVEAVLHGTRHLPTVDLFSALWGGSLQRLRAKGETLLLEYLGPEGSERYTMRALAADLRHDWHMPCFADHDDDVYLFCPHWFGIMGILPGSDCGDQPQEAFHLHWKTQLQSLTANADCTQILATMQELYRVWDTQCAWASEAPRSMSLPHRPCR